MDCQEVMSLFDYYWFEHQIFTSSSSSPPSPPTPDLEIEKECLKPELSRLQSRHVRSFSDQFSSQTSLILDSPSPKSVLTPYKHLQTILSGKETVQEQEDIYKEPLKIEIPVKQQQQHVKVGARRKRRTSSKSLSDLEFEELKGFMDLGFVFSEEDINSSLVSIIPGLQRLGNEDNNKVVKENEEDEEEEEERSVVEVSRPYLSEAWEVMNQTKNSIHHHHHQYNPHLMNWRFPSLSNEIDMKDHLRSWAHTVASTVR